MGPTPESPVTQSSSTQDRQIRRKLPIIPAIPRSLERKPKSKQRSLRKEETVATPTTEDSNGTHGETASEAHNAEDISHPDTRVANEGPVDEATKDEAFDDRAVQIVDPPPESVIGRSSTDDHSSHAGPQDLNIEEDASVLPPNLNTETIAPAPIPSEYPTSDARGDGVHDSLRGPMHDDQDTVSQQEPQVNGHPLCATASSFHAHPTFPAHISTSPPAPPPNASSLAESVTSPQQPTPATEVALSPLQTTNHNTSHAHNISFYPPPLSSNDPSSPARSLYQGYTYDPCSNGYSLHAHTSSQYSQSHQPQPETYVPPERQYTQQPSYYGNIPPFSMLGSQAPLTPSATPLAAMPEPWKTPLGYANPPLSFPVSSGDQPRHRSDSHGTLRSDDLLSGGNNLATARPQPLQTGRNETGQLHTTEEHTMYDMPIPTNFDGAQLAEHLLYHFNNPEFADCILVVIHNKQRFTKTQWFLSSILLIQSVVLRDLLKFPKLVKAAESEKRVLELSVSDRFVTPASLDSALRVLYGLPADAFTVPVSNEGLTGMGSRPSAVAMRENLAYAASGCLLSLRGPVLRGLQNASEILAWDNLEEALSFALKGRPGKEGNAGSSVMPPYSAAPQSDSIPSSSSRVVFTPSSSSGPSGQQSDKPSSSPSSSERFHRPAPQSAYDLLQHCLDFIIYNFPASWSLDLSARPLADVDRLPITAESRSPLAKSRLSRIQFGDHPSEAAAKSNDRNVLLSTILLSIPYAQLDHLLRSIGEPLARNMGAIVKERERRRQIVLQSKSVSWSERVGPQAQEWVEAGYEESLETSDEGRVEISRKYTGVGRDPTDEDHTLQ